MTKEKTFKEYLTALPKQQLISLFNNGEEGGKIISVNQAVTSLQARFTDSEYLSGVYDNLEPENRDLLRYLLFQGGSGADIGELSSSSVIDEDESAISVRLQLLQKMLLVFGVKSTPYRYFVFRDIRETMIPVLTDRWISIKAADKENGVSKTEGDPYSLFRDFVLFLLKLSIEPLRKTKTGFVNRKQVEHWSQLFTHSFVFTPDEKGVNPLSYDLFMEAALRHSLIEEDEKEIRLSENGDNYLDLDDKTKAALFYKAVADGCMKEKSEIVISMLQKAEGKGIPADDLASFLLLSKKKSKKCNGVDLLTRLTETKLIHSVVLKGGTKGYVASSLAEEVYGNGPLKVETAENATIMPTLEIMAPRFLSSTYLKKLFLCCEAVKSDAFITFKITKESVISGYERGVEPLELMQLLEKLSKNSLPQNVRFSLEDWSESWGAIAFEMHFVLRVKKPELYERIKGVVGTSTYVKEELPGTGFSINASNYPALMEILQKLGYNPKPYSTLSNHKGGRFKAKTFNGDSKFKTTIESTHTEFLLPEEIGKVKISNIGFGRKYGGKFVSLPFNELVHVINYAMLMEQCIEVELTTGKNVYFQPRELLLQLSEPKITGVNPLDAASIEIPLNTIDKIKVKE
ncbi:MAG: helicase-associated domain-containing protein [Fibrobacteres bacterium]|nr:helicase-associated domain-containing protein [Fibrobacterota bacterium]